MSCQFSVVQYRTVHNNRQKSKLQRTIDIPKRRTKTLTWAHSAILHIISPHGHLRSTRDSWAKSVPVAVHTGGGGGVSCDRQADEGRRGVLDAQLSVGFQLVVTWLSFGHQLMVVGFWCVSLVLVRVFVGWLVHVGRLMLTLACRSLWWVGWLVGWSACRPVDCLMLVNVG